MRAVFLAPTYPPEMIEYTRGLAEVGATVFGIGDTPREALPARVKPYLHDYLMVPRIMDDEDVMDRATAWLRGACPISCEALRHLASSTTGRALC